MDPRSIGLCPQGIESSWCRFRISLVASARAVRKDLSHPKGESYNHELFVKLVSTGTGKFTSVGRELFSEFLAGISPSVSVVQKTLTAVGFGPTRIAQPIKSSSTVCLLPGSHPKTMRCPGIEPSPSAWKADILTTRPTTLTFLPAAAAAGNACKNEESRKSA